MPTPFARVPLSPVCLPQGRAVSDAQMAAAAAVPAADVKWTSRTRVQHTEKGTSALTRDDEQVVLCFLFYESGVTPLKAIIKPFAVHEIWELWREHLEELQARHLRDPDSADETPLYRFDEYKDQVLKALKRAVASGHLIMLAPDTRPSPIAIAFAKQHAVAAAASAKQTS